MVTVTHKVTLEEAYRVAHEGAVVVDRSNLGMLKFTGETRLDLLQRMSTGNVINLQSGEGAATVLTTDIGRMIDRLLLYTSSEAVYALTGENNSDNVARYLMRFVFFQDDFHIEDLSAQTAIFAVYGREARHRLQPLFEENIDLSLHHWRELMLGEHRVYLHRTDAVAGDGFFVMCEVGDGAAVWQRLLDAEIVAVTEEAFDYLRIESGLPRFGGEISGDYIPLEAGLWSDVSFRKGCYIGQEIIARMESRGRLAKQLVLLRAEAPLQNGVEIEAGGRSAGSVTSTGVGPAGALALGYLKTRTLEDSDKADVHVGETAIEVVETIRR